MKKLKKGHIVIILLLVMLLCYFFWPRTFHTRAENEVHAYLDKAMGNGISNYELNEQEVNGLVKILEKSKFRHGVSIPDHMFADKYVGMSINGGDPSIDIEIYYDTDKTYVFSMLTPGWPMNGHYRISNKDEIRKYLENLIDTKTAEFEKK